MKNIFVMTLCALMVNGVMWAKNEPTSKGQPTLYETLSDKEVGKDIGATGKILDAAISYSFFPKKWADVLGPVALYGFVLKYAKDILDPKLKMELAQNGVLSRAGLKYAYATVAAAFIGLGIIKLGVDSYDAAIPGIVTNGNNWAKYLKLC